MKISKERLKQIIKEELEEADMRGSTDFDNTGAPDKNRALSAREAEAKNNIAFRILDDIRQTFMDAKPDTVEQNDPAWMVLYSLKDIYNRYMSKLRNEDPEAISIRQSNYPAKKPAPKIPDALNKNEF